jgi:hypothetical protein
MGDSHIDTDTFIGLGKRFDGIVIYQDGDVPTSRGIESYRDGRGFCTLGELATPSDVEGFFAFRQIQRTVSPSPQTPLGKGAEGDSALPPFRLFLKWGYLALPAKKLEYPFSRWRNPCCRGTAETSARNCNVSSCSHCVNIFEVSRYPTFSCRSFHG